MGRKWIVSYPNPTSPTRFLTPASASTSPQTFATDGAQDGIQADRPSHKASQPTGDACVEYITKSITPHNPDFSTNLTTSLCTATPPPFFTATTLPLKPLNLRAPSRQA